MDKIDLEYLELHIENHHSLEGGGYIRNLEPEILKGYENDHNIDVDLWSLLKPLSQEEIDRKERAKQANRKIIQPGLSLEEITKLVKEDSADINKDNGKCLENAVDEDDISNKISLGNKSKKSKKSAQSKISTRRNRKQGIDIRLD